MGWNVDAANPRTTPINNHFSRQLPEHSTFHNHFQNVDAANTIQRNVDAANMDESKPLPT